MDGSQYEGNVTVGNYFRNSSMGEKSSRIDRSIMCRKQERVHLAKQYSAFKAIHPLIRQSEDQINYYISGLLA